MFHLGTNCDGRSRHQYCSARCNGLVQDGGGMVLQYMGNAHLVTKEHGCNDQAILCLHLGDLSISSTTQYFSPFVWILNLILTTSCYPLCYFCILLVLIIQGMDQSTFKGKGPQHSDILLQDDFPQPDTPFSRLDCAAVGGSKHSALVNFSFLS